MTEPIGLVFDSVSVSQVPNSETLNRNSSRTCSFSNNSSTTSSGWRWVTAWKSRPSGVRASSASRSGCGSGSANRSRSGPVAEYLGIALGEARDVGDGLLEIAAEHQRGPVAVGLSELVARRDVGDTLR